MNITYISGGWLLIVPTTGQIIILSVLLILALMIGRASALNHLVKHHLDEILKSETAKLKREKAELTTKVKFLETENHNQFVSIQGVKSSLE